MRIILILSFLVTLSGCSSNKIKTMPKECNSLKAPKGFTYWKERPTGKEIYPPVPNKAARDRIEGCAILSFDFDKKGTATNVKILKEYPQGYDLGKLFAIYMLSNRFKNSAGKSKRAAGFFFSIERKIKH